MLKISHPATLVELNLHSAERRFDIALVQKVSGTLGAIFVQNVLLRKSVPSSTYSFRREPDSRTQVGL